MNKKIEIIENSGATTNTQKATPRKNKFLGSLRNRLLLLLIIPLIMISSLFTIESYQNAYSISKTTFDKTLSILALTLIEQDDNIFGNRLSDEILTLYEDTFGDEFFYHAIVHGSPVIVGYSKPPIPENRPDTIISKPYLFDGNHLNKPVRAAFVSRLSDQPDFPGEVRLTVWQTFDQQNSLHQKIFISSLTRIVSLIMLVACICWFGIRYGLKPLKELQIAIERRSIDDLDPIQHHVPKEIYSLVASMNGLFLRLKTAIQKRESFLANASHQLKTPLANMQGKAELALRAKNDSSRKQHIEDLIAINKKSSRLTSQMLSLLRAESDEVLINSVKQFELNALIKDVCIHYAPAALKQGREIHYENFDQVIMVEGNPLLLTESIGNLIENSMAYSHKQGNLEVKLLANQINKVAIIKICDSGPGIQNDLQDKVMSRFYRIPGSSTIEGCGLGLAIVREIVKNHNGKFYFNLVSENEFESIIELPML